MKVNVLIVSDVPQLSMPDIQQGIRDKAEAESWALKRGYGTVYLLLKKQRVYADRTSVRVDAQARKIEAQSRGLVKNAEQGSVLSDLSLILFVAFLIFFVVDWPW